MAELSDQWLQVPSDAGQTVDVSYKVDWEAGVLRRRTIDRSDNSVCVEYANILYDSVLPDEVSYEPWNGVLPMVGEWKEEASDG
jgi:hypothetical protein